MRLFTAEIDDIMLRQELRSVNEINTRISNGRYQMTDIMTNSHYNYVDVNYDIITLIICRMPLPMLLMHELPDGKYECAGDIHVFKTIHEFLRDSCPLEETGYPELDGKKFSQLHPMYQNRLEDTMLDLRIFNHKLSLDDCRDLTKTQMNILF